MPATVEIYTKFGCPYCSYAKRMLDKKGVPFTEYDVTVDAAKRQEMTERAPGARTVPQIFIDGRSIGGFDDMDALNRGGELDPLLQGAA